MIQNPNVPLTVHTFTVAVELEPNVDLEHIENKLIDSLTWVEGAGKAEVVQRLKIRNRQMKEDLDIE